MSARVEQDHRIEISASREAIWNALWTPEHYEKWTAHFHPGSRYEGKLAEGEMLRFLGPKSESGESGMASRIVKWTPGHECCLVSAGMIVDGKIVSDADGAEDWVGLREEYRLEQKDDVFVLSVFNQTPESMDAYFQEAWRNSLAEVKNIAESLT